MLNATQNPKPESIPKEIDCEKCDVSPLSQPPDERNLCLVALEGNGIYEQADSGLDCTRDDLHRPEHHQSGLRLAQMV